MRSHPSNHEDFFLSFHAISRIQKRLVLLWRKIGSVLKSLNVLSFPGEYSCLTVDLTFKREFSYYLLTIYVPCCMLVIVSWVSFWLDPNAVPARVSLGVTTLLTMSTQTASINNSLPPVGRAGGTATGFVVSCMP